jgi:hypothetical protein
MVSRIVAAELYEMVMMLIFILRFLTPTGFQNPVGVEIAYLGDK